MEKPMEVYHLDEWIIITLHVAGFYTQQYFNTSITVLTNQVWKLLIALLKVLNTGAFMVLPIIKVRLIVLNLEHSLFSSCVNQAIVSDSLFQTLKIH